MFIDNIYAIKCVIRTRESEHNAGRSSFIPNVIKISRASVGTSNTFGGKLHVRAGKQVSKISIRAELYVSGVQYGCECLEILIELKLTVAVRVILTLFILSPTQYTFLVYRVLLHSIFSSWLLAGMLTIKH
jgi:hypothetical protein